MRRTRTSSSSAAVTVAVAMAWAMAVVVGRVAAQARTPSCPPPPAPPSAAVTATSDCSMYRHHRSSSTVCEFTVQGNYFRIEYVDGKYLSLICGGSGPSLESASLPRFEEAAPLRVGHVAVEACAGAPYADVLRKMHVDLAPRFKLTAVSVRELRPSHLAGLAGLRALKLDRAGAPEGPLLEQLPALADLTVISTRLPAGELDPPPRSLEVVYLVNAGVRVVPAALLALPALRSLTVMGDDPVEVKRGDGGALRSLQVSHADEEVLAEWAPSALEHAYLVRWRAPEPTQVPACAALLELTLVEPEARQLPTEWVAHCPHLAKLEIRSARRLARLPAQLLANASSLVELVVQSSALTALPPDLFEGTPLLAHLDLSGNRLKELPSGVLGGVARSLRVLVLANNSLSARVGEALRALHHLRRLSLAHNPLRDLCNLDGETYVTVNTNKSPLESLSKLEYLDLKNTEVTAICSDWRTDMPLLAKLDLSGTRVEYLTAQALQYTRNVSAVVRVTDTPLHDFYFTAADYDAAAAVARSRRRDLPPDVTVTVTVGGSDTRLACDCSLYWLARALEERLLPVSGDSRLRCADTGGDLRDLAADELACSPPPGACPAPLPPGCGCSAVGGLRSASAVLRVRCEGAALPRLPRPHNLTDVGALDLLLADNSISDLTLDDDIWPLIRNLDLRNNSIERVQEGAALELVRRGGNVTRRVRLAGDALDCSCRSARARRVLRAGAPTLDGYGTLRCSSGGPLAGASDAECATPAPGPALVAALAGVVAVAAAGAGALVTRRGVLRRLKVALARGRRGAAPELEARPYDVFVTFGRGDEAAALEVAARLEATGAGAGAGRRVLLQERDWLPPAWVPHCIAASVVAARRTVALASPAWERSLENAEVRAAYEPAWSGALLLVLPPAAPGAPAPAPAPTDPALRRYARDYPHRVLRRDERAFWRGLERALPPPAPELAPAPASPA